MSSHIKYKPACASHFKKVPPVRNRLQPAKQVATIAYKHNVTKLGCVKCQNFKRGGCAITSLPAHFTRYCGELSEEAIEETRQRNQKYYKKNRVGRRTKEESRSDISSVEVESGSEPKEPAPVPGQDRAGRGLRHGDPQHVRGEGGGGGAAGSARSSDQEVQFREHSFCKHCRKKIDGDQYFLISAEICDECIIKEDPSDVGKDFDEKEYWGHAPRRLKQVNVLFAVDDSPGKFNWYLGRVQGKIIDDKLT